MSDLGIKNNPVNEGYSSQLAYQHSFRTFEWLSELADPATIIKQTGQLLALV